MMPHYAEHAAYIWSAFGIATSVLIAIAALVTWRGHVSRRRLTQARATLDALRSGASNGGPASGNGG